MTPDRLRPLPRGRFAGVLALAIALTWALDSLQGARDPYVMQAFWAAIIGVLGSALGWFGAQALTIGTVVAHVAITIARAFAEFSLALGGLLARIPGILKVFWGSVLRPFVGWVIDHVQAFAQWLEDTFEPIVRMILDVRQWIEKFWATYIEPILNAIEVTRRALQILEQFGIDLAAKLDAKLAELEDKITTPIREIREYLNLALNWINRIVTLDGLLQRVMLLESLWRDIGDTWAMLHNARARGVTAADRERIRTGGGAKTPAQVSADVRDYLRAGGGPLAEYVEMGISTGRSGGLGG